MKRRLARLYWTGVAIVRLAEILERVDDVDGLVEHLVQHSTEIEQRVMNIEAVCSELYLAPATGHEVTDG